MSLMTRLVTLLQLLWQKSLKQRKGFTLLEILLAIAVLALLFGIINKALDIQSIFIKTEDAARLHNQKQLEQALYQYVIDVSELKTEITPNPKPVCAEGVADGTDGCVNLDFLAAPDKTYLTELPARDPQEDNPNYLGYHVSLLGYRVSVESAHLGEGADGGGEDGGLGPLSQGVPLGVPSGGPMPSSFAAVNGVVRAAISDGAGGFFIGGDFTEVGGTPRAHLAHILGDGSLDAAWNPGTNGPVHALSYSSAGYFAMTDPPWYRSFARAGMDIASAQGPPVSAPVVYVGGSFTTLGGQPRNNLGSVHATTGAVSGNWIPNVVGGVVSAIGFRLTRIYIGGDFTTINGVARSRIGAVTDIDATSDAWYPPGGADGPVYAILVSRSVFIGGSFTTIGGQARSNLAQTDTSMGTVYAWNPGTNGPVYAFGSWSWFIASGDSLWRRALAYMKPERASASAGFPIGVYVGGAFTTFGGQPRNNLALIEDQSGAISSWSPDVSGPVRAITSAWPSATLFIGGDFTTIGGQTRNHIASVNIASPHTLSSWDPNLSGTVRALATYGSLAYAGGDFQIPSSGGGGSPPPGGFVISPTSGITVFEMYSFTSQFTFALTSAPTANVTIALSSTDTTEGTVSPASLTFTTANWNTNQTVTITPVNDALDDGDIAFSIVTAPAVSTDTAYSGLDPADVSVTNIDDDEIVGDYIRYWKFDEGTGTSAADSSGNGKTGTLVNMAAANWVATTPALDFANPYALNFQTNDYVRVASPALPTGDFTYSLWVNLDNVLGYQTLMMVDGANTEFEFNVNGSGYAEIYTNGALRLTANAYILADWWYHLAVVRQGSTITFYRNGMAAGTGTDGAALSFGACQLNIAVDADSACAGTLNSYLDGMLDEIRVYNRALTPAQITAIYNGA